MAVIIIVLAICSSITEILHHMCRFGHFLLVLVATIGKILLQNKGEGLRHREYLTITHDDVIKEYCDGNVLIGHN